MLDLGAGCKSANMSSAVWRRYSVFVTWGKGTSFGNHSTVRAWRTLAVLGM
jgi:hypothetical protein